MDMGGGGISAPPIVPGAGAAKKQQMLRERNKEGYSLITLNIKNKNILKILAQNNLQDGLGAMQYLDSGLECIPKYCNIYLQ